MLDLSCLRVLAVTQAAADIFLPMFDLLPIGFHRGFHSAHRAEYLGVVSAPGNGSLATAEEAGKVEVRSIVRGRVDRIGSGHGMFREFWVVVQCKNLKIRQVPIKTNGFFLAFQRRWWQ